MKKIFFVLVLSISALSTISCKKDDGPEATPIRDYAEQYATDKTAIDNFLRTHSMTVDANYNVTFADVTENAPNCIKLQTQYPLQERTVDEDGITYKFPYIVFNEGSQRRPTAVDSVLVSYRGVTLDNVQFDKADSPLWFKLGENTISGWGHIFPAFKTGTYTDMVSETLFSNYGAGVFFLPSGLAYYNYGSASIGAYQPIIFTVKLYELRYRDHDADGILSKNEIPASSSSDIFYSPSSYDSDGDGVPNMYDIDDDGDKIQTKFEIHKDSFGNIIFEDCDGDGIPNYLDPDKCL